MFYQVVEKDARVDAAAASITCLPESEASPSIWIGSA